MTPELHLTEEQLAVLVEGSMDETELGLLREHLRACPPCREAYGDTLRYRGIWVSDASALKAPENLVVRARRVATTRTRSERRSWRPGLVPALAAVAVIVSGVSLWRAEFSSRDTGYVDLLRPVQVAVKNASSGGSIVIPGAETAATTAAYRSGFVPASEAIAEALNNLTVMYRDGSATPDVAHWLISGFLATGDLETASVYANDARVRYPGDSRFLVLDALVAYRSRDMARAERLLQTVLRDDPQNGAAMINLGLVQYELGQWDLARRTFELARSRFAGSPLEMRAATLLSDLLNS